MLESTIQNKIRLWCGEHGYPCFRCNVGRVLTYTATGKPYYFDTGLPEGFPDLVIFAHKTVLFCEVKTKTGKQREAQKAFQKTMESLGYAYIVARSVEDVAKALDPTYGG